MSKALTPDEIVDSIATLPAFPRVVMNILATLNDENAGADALVQDIQRDTVILGQVLSAANRSEAHRAGRNIADTKQAVLVLGTRRIREIALSVSLLDYLGDLGGDATFHEHALAVSICTQELARHSGQNLSTALVAGLLHDIGRLWLLHRYPQSYQRFSTLAAANTQPVIEIEHVPGVNYLGRWATTILAGGSGAWWV
jgi:HD-like signal output (HDOD) protein